MKSYEIAVLALHNGDNETFEAWVKVASTINILNGIEYAMQEGVSKRHQIINQMRIILET